MVTVCPKPYRIGWIGIVPYASDTATESKVGPGILCTTVGTSIDVELEVGNLV